MVRPKILGEQPITMLELKKELAAIKKKDKELGFRSQKTEEYLNHFTKLDEKQAEDLKKKLEGLSISRLKEEIVTKIIDLLPITVDELKTILQGYVVTINKKDMESIIEVTKKFAKK